MLGFAESTFYAVLDAFDQPVEFVGPLVAIQGAGAIVGTAVVGAGLPATFVAYTTALQKLTPGHVMGRVTTATEVLVTTPQAVSIAMGALLVTLLDYRLIFAMMTVGCLGAVGYLATTLRGRLGPVSAQSSEASAPAKT